MISSKCFENSRAVSAVSYTHLEASALSAPVADDGKTDAESADASDDTKKAENTDANADSSANTDENKEPEKNTVYYVTDVVQQGQYIKLFKEQGMNAVILDHNIDTSFITQLEQRNDHYKFCLLYTSDVYKRQT